VTVAERFDRLAKLIAEWPPAERAQRLEQVARDYARLIDLQAQQLSERNAAA
jgi:hypothetical protein